MEWVTPPPLEPGDSVAVVAPASNAATAYPDVFEVGLRRLREVFDLDPVVYPTAETPPDELRADPAARARDVEDAFRDPAIAGVIAVIGGNDQCRVVPHLDTDVLRANPTRFFGTSDNTNLANELWKRGVVSYYGPTLFTDLAAPELSDYAERHARRAFFDVAHGELDPASTFSDHDLDWAERPNADAEWEHETASGWRWRGGDDAVRGRTWGGCLEIVDLLLAADRAPAPDRLDGAVLCVETSEELPSAGEVERFLMGLGERGLLERFGAVLVGRAKARSPDSPRDAAARAAYRERQRDAVERVVADYDADAPLVFDVDFGHTVPTAAIPLGADVVIDPATERIDFA